MATAQDEFNALFNKSGYETGKTHPEDRQSARKAASINRTPSPAQSFYDDRSDNEEDEHDDDGSDTDTAEDLAVKTMRGAYFVPRGARNANTGPKGVIADAQAFEQAKRQAQGLPPKRTQKPSLRQASPPRVYKSEDYDKSSEDDLDGDDDAFMSSWRQRRLQELTNRTAALSIDALGRTTKKKVYGELRRVDAEGFLNAVEGSPSDIVVLVLIYDHASSVSNLVEEAVRSMAPQHPSTRFVKLHYLEAEFEPAGVPALLAYRNGDKFAGFIPVSDEIPDHEELSAKSLTALLQRHQVLP